MKQPKLTRILMNGHGTLLKLFALAVLLLSSGGGCRRRDDGVTRLRFSVWGSVEQVSVEREIVKLFEECHPDINIQVMPIGSRYAEKIQAMMVGGVAPDIMMIDITQYPEWASRGVLEDLTSEMGCLERKNDVLPVPSQAFLWNGRCFGLPTNCHGLAMYCNLDALKKAGLPFPENGIEWETVLRWAPKLSRAAGNSDATTEYALLMPPPSMFFWAYGVRLFDNPFNPGAVVIDKEKAIQALELMRRLVRDKLAVPLDVVSDQGTYQLFRDGRVAFYFNGRWMTPAFAGKTDFDWDVAPPPSGPAGNTTLHGGTALGVYAESPYKKAALEFVKFYASSKGAATAMRGGRTIPIFRDLAFGEEFLGFRPPKHIRNFSKTMEKGASRRISYVPGNHMVTGIFRDHVDLALNDESLPSGQVVDELEKALERWLDNYKTRWSKHDASEKRMEK